MISYNYLNLIKVFTETTTSEIKSEILYQNGKKFIYKLSNEIIKEGNEAAKMMIEYAKAVQNSPEYKKIIADLLKNNIITKEDSLHKLTDKIDRDVRHDVNKKLMYDIFLSSDMSQDMFYAETSYKAHIYDLTDKAFKKMENDPRLKKLKHFRSIHNGDDFWGWDIILNVNEGEYEVIPYEKKGNVK